MLERAVAEIYKGLELRETRDAFDPLALGLFPCMTSRDMLVQTVELPI
jgi:hypothetical protein